MWKWLWPKPKPEQGLVTIYAQSLANWIDPTLWTRFFAILAPSFGRLTKLDINDPLSRRAVNEAADAEFLVTSLTAGEHVFGETKNDWGFTVEITPENYGGYGSLSLSLQASLTDGKAISELLLKSARCLNCFYAEADWHKNFGVRKQRLMRGVDIRRELPGLAWFTYFGPALVTHFGENKLLRAGAVHGPPGMLLQLAAGAREVSARKIAKIQKILGEEAFATSRKCNKEIGQFVPTFDRIRSIQG